MTQTPKHREFWIKARGLQEGREINISKPGEDRWIETLVQQIYPHPDNSAAVKMGPWIHVVEYSALQSANEMIDKLEMENHDLKNTSPVEGLRALREVDKMNLDSANEMIEKLEQALSVLEIYDEVEKLAGRKSIGVASEALKELKNWKESR